MSTTSVEQVRERVLQLAREIERMSQSDVPPDQFFEEFLKRVVGAVGAVAGAVWFVQGGRLGVRAEIRLSETGVLDDPAKARGNEKLLTNVLATGEASTHGPDDAGETRSPTGQLLVLAALHCEKECVGVVELFQRPDAPREARPGYLQFLEQMCGFASKYLERRKASAQPGDSQQFWRDFEKYTLLLQRSLDVNEVASTAASDGRLLLGCDRLSVALKRGKKTSIVAISGQDAVNPRANLVRAMAALSKNVIRMREPLAFTGKVENLPPQIEKPLANYVQESGSRMVFVLPLYERGPLIKDDEAEERRRKAGKERPAIGCLIVEQVGESQPKPQLLEHSELVADHVAAALINARDHGRIFLLKFWSWLGRCLEWFHGRKLAKTAAILGAVALVIASLVFVPWDYRVNGEGTLMPVIQKEVFAPWDGEVIQLKVTGGSPVQKGDVLLYLQNKDLESQQLATANQLAEKLEALNSLKAQIDEAEGNNTAEEKELIQLLGQLQQTEVEIIGIRKQLAILNDRVEALTVRAPISGTVATFQIEERLLFRPVRRGEVLMEIMDESGDWHLELEIEEHRMGHILRAQEARREREETTELPVEFRLATDPETTYEGHVEEISSRAAKSADLGNVVEMFVDFETERLSDRRIGAEVRAKIECGQRSLGYVLFGDVVEFIQKYLWL